MPLPFARLPLACFLPRLMPRALTAAAAAALLAAAPAPAQAEDVLVFAAASLADAMAEIEAGYEAASGDAVSVSLAGSSALARQIQHGAPADVFISANTAWMDALEADGLLAPGSRSDLLGNRLALVAHADLPPVEISSALPLAQLLDGGRLAMALVDAVPAGIYGKAALESLGLWSAAAPHVAQADNVRAALALVATGEAPLGIVYATDAAAEPRVKVIGLFPEGSHPAIIYPAARIKDGAGAGFLDYLRGPEARAVFARGGFTPLPR